MKLITTALPAALLAAGLATPSVASAAEPAPTNVRISWKDSTFKYVHITWDEATPQPNIVFHRVVGEPTRYQYGPHPSADAPNELDVPVSQLGKGTSTLAKEIGVVAIGPDGEASPVAVSAPFDTLGPAPARLDSFTMSGTNGMKVKWIDGVAAADDTPNDPLDNALPVRFQPRYQRLSDNGSVDLGGPITAKELSFSAPAERVNFFVDAINEWSFAVPGARVGVNPSGVKATIPTWVDANNTATIGGTVAPSSDLRPASLQARNSSTGPWYTVGTTKTSGNIWFELHPFQGTRQFRLWVPDFATQTDAYFGGYSATGTMTVQQHVVGAPLNDQIKLGLTSTLGINVGPPHSGTATLQQWNGKTWIKVGTVAFGQNGNGQAKLRATTVGRAVYRYYVPNATWRNLPVAAAYSNQFAITTVR
ncbi:hypothetical protein [Kribbella sp. NPDC006257]|uniref:hypothetical protein n=1 Tax=Kribbella sp. NPDC006257 TaxID=3156738 RepID=UPI0033B22C0A